MFKEEEEEDLCILSVSSPLSSVFVCRDWLSYTKGEGTVSHHLPVLASSSGSDDGGAIFGLVSRQRLFDDHLWLSMARRPVYSPFTRVQVR